MITTILLLTNLMADVGRSPAIIKSYSCIANNGKEFSLQLSGNRRTINEDGMVVRFFIKDLQYPNEVDDYVQFTYKNKVITYSLKCSIVTE